MPSLKTKFSVGLFMIVGMGVAILGVIWLGMSNYFEKGRFFVAYFDESVQGLDKDSPVKYRGVHIGRVQNIGVAPDERLIEVLLKIESEIEPQHRSNNIVAQLKSVGITGLMFIELERKKEGEPDLSPPLSFEHVYPVVPTRPSEISKIFKGIEDVFDLFRSLDSDAISEQLTQALKKINQTIDEAHLAALVADVRTTVKDLQKMINATQWDRVMASIEQASGSVDRMAANADGGISEIRKTVSRLDGALATGGTDMQQMIGDLKASARQVNRAMSTAAALLENTDRQVNTIQRQVVVTLNRIDRAGDTLNRFLERIADQPSQIVFSAPPSEKPGSP